MKVPVATPNESASWRVRGVVVLGCLVGMLATIGGYQWVESYAAGRIAEMGGVVDPAHDAFDNLGRIVSEAWPAQRAAESAAAEIPALKLDVSRKNVGKLARKRDEALDRGILIQEQGDYVPADLTVRWRGSTRSVRAKIRLKGDFPDHFKGDKWSFRVKVARGEQVLGMRVFSIQHPKVRGYAHEPLILEHMRREGVLAPRYEFVRVIFNGTDKGIMALEEHFSKELLESQQRRESVIVRFDEDLKWRTAILMDQQVDFSAPYPLITPFQSGKVAKSPALKRDLDVAVGLMRGFLTEELAPSDVFDPELTARFLAVAEIWGAEHALAWNNMRFYFNPITGLLEPIAFDCNLQDVAFRFIPTVLVSIYRLADDITADWLEDPKIRSPFLRELRRISTEYAGEAAWRPVEARERELHEILHREFPLIPDIQFGFYRMRSMRLTRVSEDNFRTLPLMPPNYPVSLHAFVHPTVRGFELELINLVPYPLEVTGVTCEPESVTAATRFPLVLPPTYDKTRPAPMCIELTSTGDLATATAKVTSVIQGYPNSKSTLTARPYSSTATRPLLARVTWAEAVARHPYLSRESNTARLGPGDVRVEQPLILPDGMDLSVAPGTRIRFGPKAFVRVRGTVSLNGRKEAPIDLGPAKTGWPGIAVLGAPRECRWSHVRVHGTRGLVDGSWQPTGSVMFYRCRVRLRDCSFDDNEAEDMLNLVRCTCDLQNVDVADCESDAIDMDFCTAKIRGGTIRNARGDGVDVSGSRVELSGTRFEHIRDKAISSGERSTMDVRSVHVNDAGTGVASKDASHVKIADSTFSGIGFVAVIAYMKKPEYGSGRVDASNLTIEGSKADYRVQTGSSITVDGRSVEPIAFDVDALYREGPMRKAGGKEGRK